MHLFCMFVVLAIATPIQFVCGQTCTCDLVGGLCEVNCCCDTDCVSNNDTQTFSSCINTAFSTDNLHCVYDQVVYINNIQQTVQVQQNGLFCIATDNFADRNNYIDPACTVDSSCFDSVSQTYTYAPVVSASTVGTFYTSGDPICVVYNTNAQSLFTVPSSEVSNLCKDNSPVAYFIDRSAECTRVLSNLTESCITDLSLQSATYFQNFKLSPAPCSSSTNATANTTILFSDENLVNVTLNSCVVDGVASSSCPAPVFISNQCQNAVISATYVIITNNGVSSAQVSLTLQTVTSSSLPLTQKFEVQFQTTTTGTTLMQRSGNPGYIVGKPLISGTCEAASSQVCSRNTDLTAGLTVINPDATGMCLSSLNQGRLPILFGQDVRTGCRVVTDFTNCSLLQQNIVTSLDGQTFSSFNGTGIVFVATFGNSLDSSFGTDAWVQVVRAASPANAANGVASCTGMVLSSQWEVLYANSGSISNPQPKIIGVRYSYGAEQTIPLQCFNGNCASQSLEIVTSVVFIDISETPISLEEERPTFTARLPADFFFPFVNSASVNMLTFPLTLLSLFLLYLLMM